MVEGDKSSPSRGRSVLEIAALLLFIGGFHLNFIILMLFLWFLPNIWAFTAGGIWLTNLLIPRFNNSAFANSVCKFLYTFIPDYFPIRVHVEDMDAFDPERCYVVAAEPHSLFPIGVVTLTEHYGLLPFKKIKVAGSSALCWTPVVRHVWSWLGLVPVSRQIIAKLLNSGSSIVLVPGGVQECLYLKAGCETIFLKARYGFVRCAIEAGSPLVPTFCFGQSEVYHFLKPNGRWYGQLSRAIGFTPMLFWGRYGTPVPYRSPLYMVVGRPIEVKKNPNPTREEISAALLKFIGAMEELFEKHKEEAGYKDTTLVVL